MISFPSVWTKLPEHYEEITLPNPQTLIKKDFSLYSVDSKVFFTDFNNFLDEYNGALSFSRFPIGFKYNISRKIASLNDIISHVNFLIYTNGYIFNNNTKKIIRIKKGLVGSDYLYLGDMKRIILEPIGPSIYSYVDNWAGFEDYGVAVQLYVTNCPSEFELARQPIYYTQLSKVFNFDILNDSKNIIRKRDNYELNDMIYKERENFIPFIFYPTFGLVNKACARLPIHNYYPFTPSTLVETMTILSIESILSSTSVNNLINTLLKKSPISQNQLIINSFQSYFDFKTTDKFILHFNISYNIEPIFQFKMDNGILLIYKTYRENFDLKENHFPSSEVDDHENKSLLPFTIMGIKEDNYLFIEGPVFTKIVPTLSYKTLYYDFNSKIFLEDNKGFVNDSHFSDPSNFNPVIGFLPTKFLFSDYDNLDKIKIPYKIENNEIFINVLRFKREGCQYKSKVEDCLNYNPDKIYVSKDNKPINISFLNSLGNSSYLVDDVENISFSINKPVIYASSSYRFQELYQYYNNLNLNDVYVLYDEFPYNSGLNIDYISSRFKIPLHVTCDFKILHPYNLIISKMKDFISTLTPGQTQLNFSFEYPLYILTLYILLDREEFKKFYNSYYMFKSMPEKPLWKKYMVIEGTDYIENKSYYCKDRFEYLKEKRFNKHDYVISLIKLPILISGSFDINKYSVENLQHGMGKLPPNIDNYLNLSWFYQIGNKELNVFTITSLEYEADFFNMKQLCNIEFKNHYLAFSPLITEGNRFLFHNDRCLFEFIDFLENDEEDYHKLNVYDLFSENFLDKFNERIYFHYLSDLSVIDFQNIGFERKHSFNIEK